MRWWGEANNWGGRKMEGGKVGKENIPERTIQQDSKTDRETEEKTANCETGSKRVDGCVQKRGK